MYNINININWGFKELVNNIEAIKAQVLGVIASFSCFESKDKLKFMKWFKTTVYSLNFSREIKDKIIEFVYDDIDFTLLKNMGGQNGRNKKKVKNSHK